MSRHLHPVMGFLVALAVAACGGADEAREADGRDTGGASQGETEEVRLRTLAELLRDEPRLSTLHAAIEAAGLSGDLAGEGPFTIFAPSNEAFAQLLGGAPVEVLTRPDDPADLAALLRFHIIASRIPSAALEGRTETALTLDGGRLSFDAEGSVITVMGGGEPAIVTLPDIEAANGVIHVIDKVLLPPSD